MSKLRSLRSRLVQLGRRRWLASSGSAWAAALLALLWTLAGIFLVDWLAELDKPQRLVLLAAGAAAIAWAFRRFVVPCLPGRETELDMALLVERQQKIDSDLVAALQFESPDAARWGSPQLEAAVIDYVAEFGRDLKVLQGLDLRPLKRRGAILASTALLLFGATWAYPNHALVFFNRLALGGQHYPTRTLIERIVVNGHAYEPGWVPAAALKSPYGEPLRFEVHCAGELPQAGSAELTARASRAESTVALKPVEGRPGVFTGQLDRLVDSVVYQLYLGDAWTDPAEIRVIPLPVVDVELQVTPPAYAATEASDPLQPGARQISVLEGSRVSLRLHSDKPLEKATLKIGQGKYTLRREATGRESAAARSPETGEWWRLADRRSPLEEVLEPLAYEVQVVDRDGLELKEPLRGYIRLKSDRQPRVTAGLVTQYVLPTARPRLSYAAADDYGIARLRLQRQIVREGGETSEDAVDVPLRGAPDRQVRGQLPLELEGLKLAKGDQLKITVEAIDYRGRRPGKAAHSEPLVLHVTDERGVLAAMVETDQRSARQLDAIIERQLGIGEAR